MQTTVGQLLVNEHLPEDMRDYDRVLDKKGINNLLRDVARRHPERYREISHRLADVGWRTAQETGGYSFGMTHLRKSQFANRLHGEIREKLGRLLADDRIDPKRRNEEIVKLVGSKIKDQQEGIFQEALANGNPLAQQVLSGSRGNKMNLTSLLGGDLLYMDHRNQVIPVPVLSSYAEGLKPWEYWAGTYGARKGVIDLKMATQDAGFLSKQLNQVTHRLVVEGLDHPDGGDPDRGLPVDTADADNEGGLLARDHGPYKRNTVLTPKILGHLRQLGHDRILVRSPTVGGTPLGGVYARDVGVREHGTLPGRGEYPGLAAVQAMSEPLTQAQISSKHTGGVAGEGKAISGFDYVNQLVQVPKHFKGGAAHSEEDGVVGRVVEAPAGGHYVYVNGTEHYVPTGAGLKVKTGDRVEAGDVLSEGLPNPAHVVRHKGIGEGRRYFVQAFRDAMRDAGMPAHRRNVELLGRGLINHVRLTGEMGDYVPGDVVPYHQVEHNYEPRDGSRQVAPSLARDKYLERPVLHYTVGTKVRPGVVRDLEHFGIKQVHVHDDPPPFEAEMVRGMSNLANDPDWMTRMYGSGLKGSLLKGVHRGAVSDEAGTSFVPSLARGVDFGRGTGPVRKPEPGWKPEPPAAIKVSADGLGVPGDGHGVPGKPGELGKVPSVKATVPQAGSGAPSPRLPSPVTPPAPAPAPVQRQQPQQLGFGSYQPSAPGGNGQAMMQAALPYANRLGPLGPLAVFAGLDWNALGVLTRGGQAQQRQEGAALDSPQQPAATAPAAPQAAQPTWTPSEPAAEPQQPAQAAGEAPRSTSAVGDAYDKALGVHLAGTAGNWLLRVGSKLPGVSRLPGAAAVNAVTSRAAPWLSTAGKALWPSQLMPAVSPTASRLARAGGGAVNFLGLQTAISAAKGLGNALYAGGGNPIKGYDLTSERMLAPAASPGSDNTVDVRSGLANATMDPVTTAVAAGKHGARMWRDDPDFKRDVANAVIPGRPLDTASAYQQSFDPAAAQRALGKGTASFEPRVHADGATRLYDRVTGLSFPHDADGFAAAVPAAQRDEVAARLYREDPWTFHGMFDDPVFAAHRAAGSEPPPDAAQRQAEREAAWASAFGGGV